jgi:hypothetical protein
VGDKDAGAFRVQLGERPPAQLMISTAAWWSATLPPQSRRRDSRLRAACKSAMIAVLPDPSGLRLRRYGDRLAADERLHVGTDG